VNYSAFWDLTEPARPTTIHILTMLTKPTSGHELNNGFDVVKEPFRIKSQFGIVQQHLSLNRELTAKENLELHARAALSVESRKERAPWVSFWII